jgi:maltose alpha-D-glucosyltransferase/alpha-amylase
MVTEEERQFLWRFYAPEPRMRLNLGIRRRLAPLLGNDRDRIELANSLLFTLPGSPVLYYGDEIGMGDNIWLDDRNGVRTPMQWSDVPNAGFSADAPDALYSPVIDDKIYGYQRVNVQAQRTDPRSLLNRLRQMIRIRKAHQAFSRGQCRFLDMPNKTILAYVRTYAGERILVLNNLSAEILAVKVDLEDYAADEATDLFTGEALSTVDCGLYLHLGRYQYRWLRLESNS